jgi:sulfate permease, SulP family
LSLELEFAIYAGVLLSLVLYLNRTSRPNIVTLAPDLEDERRRLVNIERKPLSECPQLKTASIDGSLFFGAIDYVDAKLRAMAAQSPGQRHLLLVCSGINFVDMAGCDLLAREGQRAVLMAAVYRWSGLKCALAIRLSAAAPPSI